MALAIVYSRASSGIEAPQVIVEVHITKGMPSLSIVGLPETAVKESKDRVRSALLNANFEFPPRRITINLAPADLPKKDGGRFDLAIAIGILVASEQLNDVDLSNYEFAGELALDGSLRFFNGALPFSLATRDKNRTLIVPQANADEAALPEKAVVLAASNLLEVCTHLMHEKILVPHECVRSKIKNDYELDLEDIIGQAYAKRVLEIAASGGHSLLLTGPPGTGKTMLASRLSTILPEMSEKEAIETAAINSILGNKFDYTRWCLRPFRAPHHTASSVALVGGSSPPKPGEISLAHNGVLFLDELPEFNRTVLEALREPLESHVVTISRAAHQVKFPANFQFIAAMNPCPCGHLGDSRVSCSCKREQIKRYRNRISGPLLDRIDMHIEVPTLPKGALSKPRKQEDIVTSSMVRERVVKARALQFSRANKLNFAMVNREIDKFCKVAESHRIFLEDAIEKMNLSARAYYRILKVARTIADLEMSESIELKHLTEALGYRRQKYEKNDDF